MPYSMIIGQEQLKLALELAFVAPRIEGVLLSGQRGTGKSTAVRAFAAMVLGRLPVTLPINATEDRVVGGWDIDELLRGHLVPQLGLLEEANEGVLYIDEVNLLDDHIVNIILDVTSTGVLVIEREGHHEEKAVRFTLVGTMNPSEGGLRPQLLDRFGLMVDVVSELNEAVRADILQAVLDYEAATALERSGQAGEPLDRVRAARADDAKHCDVLKRARALFAGVALPREVTESCVRLGRQFQVEGHRGDYIMALGARAHAAVRGATTATLGDVAPMAQLALQHRRAGAPEIGGASWTPDDTEQVLALLGDAPSGAKA